MGTLLNKSGKGQYQLLTSPWSMYFKGFFPFFNACFLLGQQGNKFTQSVLNWEHVSLNANATPSGGEFVALYRGTSKILS